MNDSVLEKIVKHQCLPDNQALIYNVDWLLSEVESSRLDEEARELLLINLPYFIENSLADTNSLLDQWFLSTLDLAETEFEKMYPWYDDHTPEQQDALLNVINTNYRATYHEMNQEYPNEEWQHHVFGCPKKHLYVYYPNL